MVTVVSRSTIRIKIGVLSGSSKGFRCWRPSWSGAPWNVDDLPAPLAVHLGGVLAHDDRSLLVVRAGTLDRFVIEMTARE